MTTPTQVAIIALALGIWMAAVLDAEIERRDARVVASVPQEMQ